MRHSSLKQLFVIFTENLSALTNNRQPRISAPLGIYTPSEINIGTDFHVLHGFKTTLEFLPPDGEISW